MMRKAWLWCAASLALAAPNARAATILEKTVTVDVRPDGVSREHTRLQVRLDSPADLDDWSNYAIPLDENRTLTSVNAHALLPGGAKVKVGRKQRDTVEYAGEDLLHASSRFELLSFTGLRVGSVVHLEHAVEIEPYYPSGGVVLTEAEAIERLRVTVRGAGAGWRWRIDGPTEGMEIEESEAGVVITAVGLAAVDPPDLAPGGAAVRPILRYAWDDDGTWEGVGRWYTELLDTLPRGTGAVRSRARALVDGIDDRRQRLEALLAFVRRQVRYVAVEVGIGGYRPTPPEQVLTRKWGDCKDKSQLLVELLGEAGITAHPAMILAAGDRRIDAEFPSPQFNHMIVAVPATAVEVGEDDPVGDGFLFVDPTQTKGSARWLHPAVQDQDALVVTGEGAALAHTPIRPRSERRALVVELSVTARGHARGDASFELRGALATGFIAQAAGAPPERTEEDVREIFAFLLPGATLRNVGWTVEESEIPTIEMVAAVTLEGMVQGLDSSSPSFRLAGLRATPEPRLLTDRELAMVVRPQTTETTVHVTLPEGWCLPKEREQTITNAAGVFRQSIRRDPPAGRITLTRQVELRERWIEPEMLPALKELSLAEHRALRRRLRLDCEQPSQG